MAREGHPRRLAPPVIRPALILLAALALRAPFFGVDVIDWDESTFILMGDAWAGGSLPYLELWDTKRPQG